MLEKKFHQAEYAIFQNRIQSLLFHIGAFLGYNSPIKKEVLEKSWFTRGTKILVCGFRREDTFVAKTYKSTKTHQLYKILDINNEKKKSFFVNLGFSAKSKGFIPEAPSLKEDFRVNMGIIYVIQ